MKTRFANNIAGIAALCLGVLLMSCSPRTPVSFQGLCHLTSDQFGNFSVDQAKTWINQTYHATPDESLERLSGEEVLSWQQEKVLLYMTFRNGRLFKFSQRELPNGPTFGQVVGGLGAPQAVSRYNTFAERVAYTLALEYPMSGISVMTHKLVNAADLQQRDGWSVRLTQDMPVTDLDCYPPMSSIEQYLIEVNDVRQDRIQEQLNRRMPWPGFGASVHLVDCPTCR